MTEGPIDPYRELSRNRVKFNAHSLFAPTFLASALSQVSEPAIIYANRIRDRQMLLENPARKNRIRKGTEEKSPNQRARLGLSSKSEVKEKGFWKFDQAQVTFCSILPLHHLWMGYMSELLGLPRPSPRQSDVDDIHHMPNITGMQAKLVKADLHGSIIAVHQSKNISTLGLSGIVLLDTENTFTIITRQDKVKTIPKQNTIFVVPIPIFQTSSLLQQSTSTHLPQTLREPTPADNVRQDPLTVSELPHIEFKLYGNQFRFHSADRASRKFKHKETIELS